MCMSDLDLEAHYQVGLDDLNNTLARPWLFFAWRNRKVLGAFTDKPWFYLPLSVQAFRCAGEDAAAQTAPEFNDLEEWEAAALWLLHDLLVRGRQADDVLIYSDDVDMVVLERSYMFVSYCETTVLQRGRIGPLGGRVTAHTNNPANIGADLIRIYRRQWPKVQVPVRYAVRGMQSPHQ